ncbi:MAG TPA: hypothetical protein VGD53_22180 [Actinoallomurus sp.]|jgi:two-component system sensor histidine kinase DesK
MFRHPVHGRSVYQLRRAQDIRPAQERIDELLVRQQGTPLPDEAGSLLGWAVREGVTNIIRHSRAASCEISVDGRDGTAVLSIRDDGEGGSAIKGNGLHGLTERVTERRPQPADRPRA